MMHAIAAVLPQFLVLIALLVLAYVPLGSWMARSYTSERDWACLLYTSDAADE